MQVGNCKELLTLTPTPFRSADARYGPPRAIATTDKFQGQQNDYILLSLVRTKTVGHLRDVRRYGYIGIHACVCVCINMCIYI